MSELILTKDFDKPETISIDGYISRGGYEGLKKALAMPREKVTEEVKNSRIRGRGGAGFPAGDKWGFINKDRSLPRYLCVNADEGEPGTFKDRALLLKAPHQLLEGIAIACHALEFYECWIYFRGEFVEERRVIDKAIAEAEKKGFLGLNILGSFTNVRVKTYSGAGAYICGEAMALLESLEGKKGFPRIKPPRSATKGLYKYPTIVNNVETLSFLPAVMRNGSQWFLAQGLPDDGGTKLYCLSGHINRPGLYELPIGTSLRELIYTWGGGIPQGRQLKAVLPGGTSTPFLAANEISVAMDFASMEKAGSALGTGAVMVFDETACMLDALKWITRFYAHESCGQCTPCREGTGWLERVTDKLRSGQGQSSDLDLMDSICHGMHGKTICEFSDAVAMPVQSLIKKFRPELEQRIKEGGCKGHMT